jgi:hypothetical protein
MCGQSSNIEVWLVVHNADGHHVGCPERPRPMSSPRTPFFWFVNSRAMKVTLCSSYSVAVIGLSQR